MPLLDVSDILFDPDFCEAAAISCLHVSDGTGNNGRAQPVETPFTITGNVQPGDGDSLQLLPEAERVAGSIVVFTPDRLNVATPGQAADVVLWQGNRYMVRTIADYSNYGAGYIEALCILEAMVNGVDP